MDTFHSLHLECVHKKGANRGRKKRSKWPTFSHTWDLCVYMCVNCVSCLPSHILDFISFVLHSIGSLDDQLIWNTLIVFFDSRHGFILSSFNPNRINITLLLMLMVEKEKEKGRESDLYVKLLPIKSLSLQLHHFYSFSLSFFHSS